MLHFVVTSRIIEEEILDFSNQANFESDRFSDKTWGADQLKSISFFDQFKTGELEDLYTKGEVVSVPPKSHVVVEGESSRGLYILLRGTVSIFKTDPVTNAMVRLTLLEEGAFFGELSLFDDAPRSATVTAESSCILFSLGIAAFEDFLKTNGDDLMTRFYKRCAEEMGARFRLQNAEYISSQHLLWKYALRK